MRQLITYDRQYKFQGGFYIEPKKTREILIDILNDDSKCKSLYKVVNAEINNINGSNDSVHYKRRNVAKFRLLTLESKYEALTDMLIHIYSHGDNNSEVISFLYSDLEHYFNLHLHIIYKEKLRIINNKIYRSIKYIPILTANVEDITLSLRHFAHSLIKFDKHPDYKASELVNNGDYIKGTYLRVNTPFYTSSFDSDKKSTRITNISTELLKANLTNIRAINQIPNIRMPYKLERDKPKRAVYVYSTKDPLRYMFNARTVDFYKICTNLK